MPVEIVTVKKLDAAEQQLHTAIALWFADGDPVLVHTLACAAHQIVHDINEKNNGAELFLDSSVIKNEFRKEYLAEIRKAMNFFKHANNDPDPNGTVEFAPAITELFILFTVIALERFGKRFTELTSAFLFFYRLQNPRLFKKEFGDRLKIEDLPNFQIVPKREFLKQFLLVRREQNHA